jgi:pimeloyl-ACP methyl ester carboxylesterase
VIFRSPGVGTIDRRDAVVRGGGRRGPGGRRGAAGLQRSEGGTEGGQIVTQPGGCRSVICPCDWCMAQLLARSQAPVILARGENDPMNTDEQLARLGAPTVTLPGPGHNAHVERPELSIALLSHVDDARR